MSSPTFIGSSQLLVNPIDRIIAVHSELVNKDPPTRIEPKDQIQNLEGVTRKNQVLAL